jgi:hypothetical protein
VVGALKEAGFGEVIQYDRFLLESVKRDAANGDLGRLKMFSWCKGACNYVQGRISDSELARSEENAPWRLLLDEKRGKPVCLLSPCTALKGVEGFAHVLSVMELDELFKQLEIDPEVSKPRDYRDRVKVSGDHPGFSSVKLAGGTSVNSLRISKGAKGQIGEAEGRYLDLFPCLDRCLSGGGNYPTVDRDVIINRRRWLASLWEVDA